MLQRPSIWSEFCELNKGLNSKLLHLSYPPYRVNSTFTKFFRIHLLHGPGIIHSVDCVLMKQYDSTKHEFVHIKYPISRVMTQPCMLL